MSECGAELEWSEFGYVCELPEGHASHHRDNRFGRFEWRNFDRDPEPDEKSASPKSAESK